MIGLENQAVDGRTRLKVLVFSLLREKLNADELNLEYEKPLTGHELLDDLSKQYPAMAPYRPIIRIAVNQRYSAEHAILKDGDEVALITPVSGG